MREKSIKERFTIQFSGTDPAHIHAAEYLNRQGMRSKAQYIVNAILHYESCSERTGIGVSSSLDIKAVEAIVGRMLMEKKAEASAESQQPNQDKKDSLNLFGNDGLNAIAGSINSFRKNNKS